MRLVLVWHDGHLKRQSDKHPYSIRLMSVAGVAGIYILTPVTLLTLIILRGTQCWN
jgi:hypothetical protein